MPSTKSTNLLFVQLLLLQATLVAVAQTTRTADVAGADVGKQQRQHTEIMNGFVDTGADSRDGRLDNGAEAFTFDGVLDVGQPSNANEAVVERADNDRSVADAAAPEIAVPQHYWRHDGPPEIADGIRDTGDLNEHIERIADIGVDGIREYK